MLITEPPGQLHPKLSLFFTETAAGRGAGRAFLARLKEHTHDRDKDISLPSLRAQLKAMSRARRCDGAGPLASRAVGCAVRS